MRLKMENLRNMFIWMALVALGGQIFAVHLNEALAAPQSGVVINEIGWAGTPDESNDEFIELFNTSRSSVDLSGWTIEDDNGSSVYTIDSGSIGANGYFVIVDGDGALSGVNVDKVIGLSLANSGDSLVLKDANGLVVDTVNGSGQAWYGGNSTSKASMEKIDPNVKDDVAENWGTCAGENGAKGRTGGAVLATPGSVNSVFAGATTKVELVVNGENFETGDFVNVSANISGAEELFAYGFNIKYDPSVVKFVSAEEGTFLGGGGGGDWTAFNYALENGVEGNLIVGGTRLLNPPSGVNGGGELFAVEFEVVGAAATTLSFVSGESFISDINGDVPAGFTGGEISIGAEITVSAVGSPKAEAGDERYAIELSWLKPAGDAEKYLIKRKNSEGNFVQIGETIYLSFIDNDDINSGGKLIPEKDYEYQIFAVKAGTISPAQTIIGKELRGLKGDMTRDDKVNGKDLEKLARSFGLNSGAESFDALCDTNYDGLIDGSDLIDIGANFGKTFSL
ncbi:MAG: lamin tail domain-containing protein [Candidatus Gracilibacteria bacterium]|jgi:hypothetical protein